MIRLGLPFGDVYAGWQQKLSDIIAVQEIKAGNTDFQILTEINILVP